MLIEILIQIFPAKRSSNAFKLNFKKRLKIPLEANYNFYVFIYLA